MSFRRLFDRKGCERGLKKLLCLFFAVFLAASLAVCGNSKSSSSAAAASTGGYDSEGVPEAGANSAALSKVDEIERKLVYRADVSAETKDFERAKADLDSLVAEVQGYVESSDLTGSSYGGGGNRRLSYTVRVPADSLQGFLAKLEELVNVVSNSTYMEDITGSYFDTQARLNALEQEEKRLLELLEKAETLDEIIQLEDRISNVRYEIESLTSQMKIYDKEVAYSTVSIFLEDVTEYSAKSSFGSRTWEAFTGGWNSFVSTVQSVIVALIWFLPFLVVGGAVVIIVVVCVKRSGRKKRAKFLADTENIAPEYVPTAGQNSNNQPEPPKKS